MPLTLVTATDIPQRRRLRRGRGHHGAAARLHRGHRYLLVTASNYAVPVRVVGKIRDGHGTLILVRQTR